MIAGVPWWIFMLVVLIFVSGFMAFRAMRAEKKLEHYYIEREGDIYMERIRQERDDRRQRGS